MKVNIFNSLEEAEKAQAYDLKKYLEFKGDGNGYDEGTTRWCEPIKRTDGKYTTTTCLYSDAVYETVDYCESDYPLEEVPEDA